MAITIFLPVRKGSERVNNKNTRRFGRINGGLLELKLNQLEELEGEHEILVSTNDEKCWEIASRFQKQNSNIRVIRRPEVLGRSDTVLSDLICHVPEITSSEEILWTHVTSPFCDAGKYTEAISKFEELKNSGYDSLISGSSFRNFLIDKENFAIVNNPTQLSWPRTQDLVDLFEINNAIFIASREMYIKGNRIGSNPFLMEFDKLASLDIDDEDDFKIAEAVYERIYR